MEGSDRQLRREVEQALGLLTAELGMEWEVQSTFPPADASLFRLAVFLPPVPEFKSLADSNPETQFIVVGSDSHEPTTNISIVSPDGLRPDRQGFLAGYVAALVSSPNWRVASIADAGPSGTAAANGFSSGVPFYCGLCRPAYPPFSLYPVGFTLEPGSEQDDIEGILSDLALDGIEIVYVFGFDPDEGILETLAAAGLRIISDRAPTDALAPNWIVTIRPDLATALSEVIPSALAGEGGLIVDLELELSHTAEAILTPGKQREVDEILQDLNAGYIDTGVDLQTGEVR